MHKMIKNEWQFAHHKQIEDRGVNWLWLAVYQVREEASAWEIAQLTAPAGSWWLGACFLVKKQEGSR